MTRHDYHQEKRPAVWIAYLEKQKEQKPVDYDHEMWKNCEANFEGGKKEVIDHPEKYGLQKEQKPADKEQYSIAFLEQHGYTIVPPHAPVSIVPSSEAMVTEWSEEDERIRKVLYGHFSTGPRDCQFRDTKLSYHQITAFLKSLRPKPHWKPSEEQMRALIDVICFGKISYVGQEEELIALKNQLLKLM